MDKKRDNKRIIDERGEWEKVLRDKLLDYEYSIEQLPPLQLPAHNGSRHKWRHKWLHKWQVWVGAASVAAAVLVLIFLLPHTEEPSLIVNQGEQITSIESIEIVPQERENTLNTISNNPLLAKSTIDDHSHYTEAYSAELVSSQPSHEEVTIDTNAEVYGESDDPISPQEGEGGLQEVEGDPIEPTIAPKESATMVLPRRHQPQLKLAINVSGAPAYGSNATDITTFGSQLIGVMDSRYFEPKEEQFGVREGMPLEIGASVVMPLSERWRVEGGLKYSYRRLMVSPSLSPDFSMETHSIGVPLNLQYIIGGTRQWSWYITGGGEW